MPTKNRKISALIESQLPGFISSEYENFSLFVEKYYEHLESQGGPLDIINNITKYRDIDFYEKNLLNQFTILSSNITNTATTIAVSDASSFPKKNGYFKIDDEICFYKERTDTQFLEVSRGVSGNTILGDLYTDSVFVTTQANAHLANAKIYNVSNLFLYALIKNFETQYLSGIPEKYLKGEINKRTLIKNIGDFYKAKGTSNSIKFIFNSIIAKEPGDVPEVYNPKDFTLKSSVSDWQTTYSLKVKILSGNPANLIGERIVQDLDPTKPDVLFASAIVDNIIPRGGVGGDIYEIILDPSSINGSFEIASKTKLTTPISGSDTLGNRIDVVSTLGWRKQGRLLVNNEQIYFGNKTVNQFIIERRGSNTSHNTGSDVYSFSTVNFENVNLLVLGVLYNFNIENPAPYSQEGDLVQITSPGFSTLDPIIYDRLNNKTRWFINENNARPTSSLNPTITSALSEINADVSGVYEDDQYYYICSSSYPSTNILNAGVTLTPEDLKVLKIIRKQPTTTTEVYETGTRDVGIFVDGTLAFSSKDPEYVNYGKITNIKIASKGDGYKFPPYVLINNQPGKASAVLSGEVVEKINIETEEIFTDVPTITITAGRNAQITAIVTSGRITSLRIDNPGEYYSAPPAIIISDLAGKGRFAEFNAIVSNGKITGFDKINEGKFYTQENVRVEIIENAKSSPAVSTAELRKWYRNRYSKYSAQIDSNNGYLFESFASIGRVDKDYGYGVIANPKRLRYRISDNITSTFNESVSLTHSPIIGFAYDGNPIYGPYAYSNPLNSSSSIVRLSSGYSLKSTRTNGPSTTTYPLGTFVDDYEWIANVNSGGTILDRNNGRYCVTPEYPNGTYAYFLTFNAAQTPQFPYILGERFYSLPVDSNYNSIISQDDLPSNSKVLNSAITERNGDGVIAQIEQVNSGSVSEITVESSRNTAFVDADLYINNNQTSGFGLAAKVRSVKGKQVTSIEALQTKCLELSTTNTAYLFAGDTITQASTGATGRIIGDVFSDKKIVLRNVSGTFNTTNLINSNTSVIVMLLDNNATFTKGANIILTDGVNSPVASGVILESIVNQNSLKVRVTSGNFVYPSPPPSPAIPPNYTLRSDNLNDSTGIKFLSTTSLSNNLSISSINENIALVTTSTPHNITIGDDVNIDILPNSATTETTYQVRKRNYQSVILQKQQIEVVINDTGAGRVSTLNSGIDYQTNVYSNIELIFQNQSLRRNGIGAAGDSGNARATITVSNIGATGYGAVTSVVITNKGSGYKRGDILTVSDASLNRLVASTSTQRLLLEVVHVGISSANTLFKLDNVVGISQGDILRVSNELLLVSSVNETEKSVTVVRGYNSTRPDNYYNKNLVTLEKTKYNFIIGTQPVGSTSNDPYVHSYNEDTQELILNYGYGINSPNELDVSNTFFDTSVPRKLVKISSVTSPENKFEFSKNGTTFNINPVIDVQKYYQYKFDTSHSSMIGTFLEFSPSIRKNIITVEAIRNSIAPGSSGSFTTVKFGVKDGYKVDTKYIRYYYYDKNDAVQTNGSYLNLIEDPLQGLKRITYVTPTRFVYPYTTRPQYDGSGSITYTTTSKFAVGEINSVSVENTGESYKKLPIIEGVEVHSSFAAKLIANYDSVNRNVFSVTVVNGGSGYSKPKVVVETGDGINLECEVFLTSGIINRVLVTNKGSGFTSAPTLKVIETNVKVFASSKDIGTPKVISLIENGYNFNADKTNLSSYRSHYVLLLKNTTNDYFFPGEKIIQVLNGIQVFSGYVSKDGWRPGSNILRIEKTTGIVDKNLRIRTETNRNSGDIISVIYSQFNSDIKTYFDNYGYYTSDKGKIGINSQRLTDSSFYQDFSYVIKSKTPIAIWKDLIKETVHPAGFNVFGEVIVESSGVTRMPQNQTPTKSITILNLSPQQITVVDTKRQITQTILNQNNLNVERGYGSVVVDTFNSSETLVYELKLNSVFNGSYSSTTGQRIGTRSFNLIESSSGTVYTPANQNQLIITLDGILQEPGESFVLSGSQITFYEPPLSGQKFYCRTINFKNTALNSRYFRKLKSLSPNFDGITKEFNLYYENGDLVKTDLDENLIVCLNGVVQKSKNEIFKFNDEGNIQGLPDGLEANYSYRIIRSSNPSTPDKIDFSTPPINHDDYYRGQIPDDLSGVEKSFLFSVGSYIRLTIDVGLSQYLEGGPYLIKDANTGKVYNIDNPKYALVFVDGVLQVENESYTINGAVIRFRKPLTYNINESGEATYQKVNIILLYGRSIPSVLTFHNFEPDTYYNEMLLTINLANSYSNFNNWYRNNLYSHIYVFQNSGLLGTLVGINKISSNSWTINLIGNNAVYNPSQSIKFTTNETLQSHEFEISGSTTNLTFKLDNEGNRIVSRVSTRSHYGSSQSLSNWIQTSKSFAKLLPGDKVQIDGEKSFREIKSVPYDAKSKNFIDYQTPSTSFYAKVNATGYNDISRGEGLSVTSRIDSSGKVVGLDWNRRDLQLYFEENILLQPTAYQYFTTPSLQFIPKDGNGGGAQGQVIVYGGDVIDIVITNPGSGYTQPPLVVVTRGYNRIKEYSRKTTSIINVSVQPNANVGFTLISAPTQIIFIGAGQAPQSIFSLITFGINVNANTSKTITSIIEPAAADAGERGFTTKIITTSNAFAGVAAVSVVDVISSITNIIDPRVETISQFTKYETNREITARVEKVINEPHIYVPRESVNEIGTFLDSPLGISDTIAYVPNTIRFAAYGKLMIGTEVVTYYNKGFNKFENLVRGYANSPIQNHPAGTYLRTLPEFVSFASVGPEVEVQTTVTVRTVSVISASTSTIASTVSTVKSVTIENLSVAINSTLEVDTFVDTKITREVTTVGEKLRFTSSFSGFANVLYLGLVLEKYIHLETQLSSVSSINASVVGSFTIQTDAKIVKVEEEITRRIEEFATAGQVISTSYVSARTNIWSDAVVTTVQESQLVVTKFYKTGVLDYYQETTVLPESVLQRNLNQVVLVNRTEVVRRNGTSIFTINLSTYSNDFFYSYSLGNVGNTIGMFDSSAFISTGSTSSSSMSLQDIELIYPAITLNDFTERDNSAITLSGERWNLAIPSIQEPVAISASSGNITTTINVQSTTNFLSSGYLFTGNGGVVQYTGKTQTSFTGCSVVRGSNSLNIGTEIVPHAII